MSARKTLQKVLAGSKNVRFQEMLHLAAAFGFHVARISGSHHILSRSGIPELVNLQNVHGQAKPYQIRQFVKLVEKYNLTMME